MSYEHHTFNDTKECDKELEPGCVSVYFRSHVCSKFLLILNL